MLEEENNTKKDEVKTSEGRKQNVKNSRAIPKSIITFLFLFFSFEFIYSRYFCNFIIQHNSFPVS